MENGKLKVESYPLWTERFFDSADETIKYCFREEALARNLEQNHAFATSRINQERGSSCRNL